MSHGEQLFWPVEQSQDHRLRSSGGTHGEKGLSPDSCRGVYFSSQRRPGATVGCRSCWIKQQHFGSNLCKEIPKSIPSSSGGTLEANPSQRGRNETFAAYLPVKSRTQGGPGGPEVVTTHREGWGVIY